MRPEVCRNCGSSEIQERADHYVCAYCETRYNKEKREQRPVYRENQSIPTSPQPVYQQPVYTQRPTGSQFTDPARMNKKPVNKWVALLLCYFLGLFGAHKFYEGKTGAGILYLCTMGVFGMGWLLDLFLILFKPNPYYV